MNQPKISVIIPVYKVPLGYLRACLDSLIDQTMLDCEFIIVSDGAPEKECSICEEYTTKDSRFKFYRHKHAGVSTARNYGIDQAQGEYITFVDSDDRITNNFCSSIYAKAKEWNSDILLFEQISKNRNATLTFSLYMHDIPSVSMEQYQNLIIKLYCPQSSDGLILAGICCKAYRRLFIKANNLYFQPKLHYSEDQFFCLTAFLATQNISYFANSPLYIQNHRSSSASFSYKPNYEREVLFYLKKIYCIIEKHPQLLDKIYFYNRTIQCILYTLDICIFRPDNTISIIARQTLFRSFLDNIYCKESLLRFRKKDFSFSERIACYFCKKKCFWLLLLVSKKWHIKKQIEHYRNRVNVSHHHNFYTNL